MCPRCARCARRYELNTQVSYDLLGFAGQKGHDPNYIAYQKVGAVPEFIM